MGARQDAVHARQSHRRPRRSLIVFALAPACSALLVGFTGDGEANYRRGLADLNAASAGTSDTGGAENAVSTQERLEHAIDELRSAKAQTSTPSEASAVDAALAQALNRVALEHAKARDFTTAATEAKEASELAPDNWVLAQNVARLLEEGGDYEGAASAFTHCIQLARDPASQTASRQGLIRMELKSCEGGSATGCDNAISDLTSWSGDKDEPWVLQELGEAYYLKGDGRKAVEIWERASALGPLPAGLAQKYARVKAGAQIKEEQSYTQFTGRHFTLEYGAKTSEDLAGKVLGLLDEAYDVVGRRYSCFPSDRIAVSLFVASDYDRAVQVPWSAGLSGQHKIDIRVRRGMPDAAYRDIALHEYTHVVVDIKAGQKAVPTWLNEGLAMHSEEGLDVAHYSAVLASALQRTGHYFDFTALSSGFTRMTDRRDIELAYAQSYSATGALIQRFGLEACIAILERLAGGSTFDAAFDQVTGMGFGDFERDWAMTVRPGIQPGLTSLADPAYR